jgi:hypothetical protein
MSRLTARLFFVLLFIPAYAYASLQINARVITGQNVSITGSVAKGSGTFVIDHPLDPENKLLYHSFVESPDVLNIYDGIAALDERGEAVVRLPDYYEALNGNTQYFLRPLAESMQDLHVKEKVRENRFLIAGGAPGGEVSWMVTGVRKDPYILANPIVPEVRKGPDALARAGEYLFPEYYGSGKSSLFSRLAGVFGNVFRR